METLGVVSVLVLGAGVVAGAVLAVLAIPDFNRYRRLRKM